MSFSLLPYIAADAELLRRNAPCATRTEAARLSKEPTQTTHNVLTALVPRLFCASPRELERRLHVAFGGAFGSRSWTLEHIG